MSLFPQAQQQQQQQQQPQQQQSQARPSLAGATMPMTDAFSPVKREDRDSADKLSSYLWEQYQSGLRLCDAHTRRWVKVKSIMSGIHYFTMTGGKYRRSIGKPGEIRATVPVMAPKYRVELGRLNSNPIGVSSVPRIGRDASAIYDAGLAQSVMDTWLDEARVHDFYDESNQHLLFYGTVGYMRVPDMFNRQVLLRAVPGPELFPVPFDATTIEQADGLMRVQLVTKQWLEMQDELAARKNGGQKPQKLMANVSSSHNTTFDVTSPGLGVTADPGGKMEGALAITTWMKPSATDPGGSKVFMLNDEIFGFIDGQDQEGNSLALPNGKIPIEIVYYNKRPDDFWADGFCETQIAPQLEANRQMTAIVKSARYNTHVVAYNSEAIKAADVQNADSPFVPFEDGAYEDNTPPLISVPSGGVSRDVGVVMELVGGFSDQAANHESGILTGRSEGRVEAGPATQLLNANAQAPLQPVLDRIFQAFKNTYPEVLSMIRDVWPKEKWVRASDIQTVSRDILIGRDRIPSSDSVTLTPTPLMANGRNEMVNMLFRLRTMPAENGQLPELSSREFRRSLRHLNMNPPGLDIADKAEQRIRYRVNQLIGDGVNPGRQPPGFDQDGRPTDPAASLEAHALAMEIIREYILDPAFDIYSPQVKSALMEQLKFHRERLAGVHPDRFDDDTDEIDRLNLERSLHAAEDDFETNEGQVSLDGLPIGV